MPLCCRRHARFVTKTERNQAHKLSCDYFVPLTSAVAPITLVHESQYQRDVYEVALSDAQPHGFTAQNSNNHKSCFQPAVTSVDTVWVRLNPEPSCNPVEMARLKAARQQMMLDMYQRHHESLIEENNDLRQEEVLAWCWQLRVDEYLECAAMMMPISSFRHPTSASQCLHLNAPAGARCNHPADRCRRHGLYCAS